MYILILVYINKSKNTIILKQTAMFYLFSFISFNLSKGLPLNIQVRESRISRPFNGIPVLLTGYPSGNLGILMGFIHRPVLGHDIEIRFLWKIFNNPLDDLLCTTDTIRHNEVAYH